MPPVPEKEPMTDVCTLVLRSPLVRDRLADLLVRTAPRVNKKLYLQFCPTLKAEEYLELVPAVYSLAAQHCPLLDVRILLGKASKTGVKFQFDDGLTENDIVVDKLLDKKYKNVVLGGTFDNIHYGHKVLLSSAILLASNRITCGVTDGPLVHSKKLWELITPCETRIDHVKEFISDVSDGIYVNAVPITDPFGPSIIEEDLECCVVSKETIRGGNAINEKRVAKGLSHLDIFEIGLLEGEDKILSETKLSSSAIRRSKLGKLLKETSKPVIDFGGKYVIGLTGGICSGKTHISKFLASKGCFIIDCDTVGHEVMRDSERIREQIAEQFGQEMVKDGQIDRKALGAYVFHENSRLEKLQDIMWPIMIERVINRIKESSEKIFIVDAAVLFKAGWDKYVNEVWTAMVPTDIELKRVMERDNLTEELAKDRMKNQVKTSEMIKRSHVVISSQWEYEETQRQVTLALERVKKCLEI